MHSIKKVRAGLHLTRSYFWESQYHFANNVGKKEEPVNKRLFIGNILHRNKFSHPWKSFSNANTFKLGAKIY